MILMNRFPARPYGASSAPSLHLAGIAEMLQDVENARYLAAPSAHSAIDTA
jgi:hypothetical protein